MTPTSPVTVRGERHRSGWPALLFAAAIFLATFVFFTRVCPLVPSDSDDWVLMAKVRSGLPEWGAFNPSKVLPETLLHLVNYVAAFLVMPFTGGDYVWSLVVAAALIVSAFVTGYLYLFHRLLCRKVGAGPSVALCVSTLFYLAHFVLLSHTSGESIPYLLGSRDFTGYFHYTIPYLMCASTAMGIALRGPGVRPQGGDARDDRTLAALVLCIYLGMCSNLYLNIVLAAFSGACLVASLAQIGAHRRHRWTVRTFVRANALHFYVLALWLLTLAFELSGQRAVGAMGSQGLEVGAVVADMLATLSSLSRGLALLFVVALVGAALVLLTSRDRRYATSPAAFAFVCIGAWFLTTLFIVLLSAVMNPYTQGILPAHYYASRPDVLVGAAFPCLVLGCAALALVMKRVRLARLVSPILAFVVAVSAVNGIGRYEQPVRGGITAGSTLAAAEDMVGQIEAADQAGQASVEVRILLFQNDVAPNWPLMPGMGGEISDCLYTAGVTSKRMDVTLVPDASVNERMGLPRDIGASA